MKIAHISPSAISEGSAAHRIRKALRKIDVDAFSLVHLGIESSSVKLFNADQKKARKNLDFYHKLNRIPLANHPRRDRSLPWSCSWFGFNPNPRLKSLQVDVAHLHWVASGCVSFRELSKLELPIVWTLHDVWAITGGCHCNLGCELWKTGCQKCPQLKDGILPFDASNVFWNQKLEIFSKIKDLTIVSPSRWLAQMASLSPLFKGRKIAHIPNCIDTELFQPNDKKTAQQALGISTNALVVLFGAVHATSVAYKGFDLLLLALAELKRTSKVDLHLVVFGADAPTEMIDVQFPVTWLGSIEKEQKMAQVYSCADVFVGPSRQDNFPNTFLEASACGIPTVGFDVGGIPEITLHQKSGYIAKSFDWKDLAHGIKWVLESPERRHELSIAARNHVLENFSEKKIATLYKNLYQEIINGKKQ